MIRKMKMRLPLSQEPAGPSFVTHPWFVPTFLIVFFSLSSMTSAQAGKTGLAFLKLGVGGRAVAMGEAHVALAADASATYFNPAGLAAVQRTDVMLMHKEWFQGVQTEFLAVVVPLGGIAAGLSINTTNIRDIQVRTRPGPPEANFSSHDFSLGLSLGSNIRSSFNAGVTLKFLYEKIFVEESSGAAVDLGLRYEAPIQGLTFGFTLSNLGSMGTLKDEKIKLPSLLRLGSSYVKNMRSIQSTLALAGDVVNIFQEKKAHFHTGAELTYSEIISLRFGYLSGYDTRNVTLGVGLHKDPFRIDYGLSPQSQSLSTGHTVSVGVEF